MVNPKFLKKKISMTDRPIVWDLNGIHILRFTVASGTKIPRNIFIIFVLCTFFSFLVFIIKGYVIRIAEILHCNWVYLIYVCTIAWF